MLFLIYLFRTALLQVNKRNLDIMEVKIQ